jgi:RNA polymerase subunit RPABC4/transcription elongation factor Spt4
MEIVCNRCRQAIQAENCYCPFCGLPHLVFANDGPQVQAQTENWNGAGRDASNIAWKPALSAALKLALPVGMLCSMFSPVSILGFFGMAAAATWVVALYMRSQRPAWITIGAGARIGLVTGLLGGWTAAATSAVTLFALRFFFHQGGFFDGFWQSEVSDKVTQQWAAAGIDAPRILAWKTLLNSPEGRGGMTFLVLFVLILALVAFATVGGALGARLVGRSRSPQL